MYESNLQSAVNTQSLQELGREIQIFWEKDASLVSSAMLVMSNWDKSWGIWPGPVTRTSSRKMLSKVGNHTKAMKL